MTTRHSSHLQLALFLVLLLMTWFVIPLLGTRYLLVRWEAGLDLRDAAAVEAALESHRWALTRYLWLPLNAAALLLVLGFRRLSDRGSLAALGAGAPRPGQLLLGLALGAGLAAIVGVALLALAAQPAELPVNAAPPPGIVEALALFAITAVTMELVMRGYVFTHLLGNGRVVRAVLGSALIFALFQSVSPDERWAVSVLNMVLLGILLGLLRLGTGAIWAPAGFQLAWNAVYGPLLGFPISGLPFRGALGAHGFPEGKWADLAGGSFGPEAGLLCTVVLALASLIVARLNAPRFDRRDPIREPRE